jgi:3-oxoacyl-[acyl-carrier-protein] synthase III
MNPNNPTSEAHSSFFQRKNVSVEKIPIGSGIQIGIERVSNPILGIGGAYGAWGDSYDNSHLTAFIENRLGETLDETEIMNLADLGFTSRHHVPTVSDQENLEIEIEVGSRMLREAALANGWQPEEVEAVLIGSSGPVSDDYTEQIAHAAGIPDSALKVSVHKACDSSMGALHLAMNPNLGERGGKNLARELFGRKILVGGIEGLSRFVQQSRDKNALQLFGNGAGIIGVIPGKTMKFLVGKDRELFDEQGVLEVRMFYPHSRQKLEGQSMIEISQPRDNYIRVAGLMHEPEDDSPVVMAGPMGMVKLFVRTGVEVVQEAYQAYKDLMEELGTPDKSIAVTIVHHANYKINQLKAKHLKRIGIQIPMPWLLSEFGNVSAASNMIAFMRKLGDLKPGDHILFDGFGAGTYYDALAVELGGGNA